jgi:hypothetical protein
MKRFLLAGSALVLMLAWPLAAHHSFVAEFDTSKAARMDGRVTDVEWVNPHVRIFLDVVDSPAGSGTTNWTIETGPPNALMRIGLTRDDVRPGVDLRVEGFLARDGQPLLGSSTITVKSTGRLFTTPQGNFLPVK